MATYKVTVELDAHSGSAVIEGAVRLLADFQVAVRRSIRGRAELDLTISANSLRQATGAALAMVSELGVPAALHAMSTAELEVESGLPPLPNLLSVTETAEILGISRRAVLRRIEAGSLPAHRIGNSWAVLEIAVPR